MNAPVRLGEIAEVRPGYLSRKSVNSRVDGTHYLLQIRDFNRERTAVDSEKLLRFNPESLASVQPLQAGEIVFLARGAKHFAYATSALPRPTLAAGYFFVIRPLKQVNPLYLSWFLNHPTTLLAIARVATSGAHMPVVRRADIENLPVPLPSMAIQRAITELDQLMRQEQILLKELTRRKYEIISAVCMAAAQAGQRTGETS